MNKDKLLPRKLYHIASLGFFIAALGFFIAAIIGSNLVYSLVGVASICLGTLYLILAKQYKKSTNDSEN